MASCPNKSSQEYKEMVNALGDKLTHYIWDKNNGNPIHLAPNGKPSKLFNDLVEQLGNKEEAIRAKARVYSKNFRNWFGDWLGNNKENINSIVNNKSIILPIGTSGSGKSTWIRKIQNETNNAFIVVEPDAIRYEITGSKSNKSKDKEVYELAYKRIISAVNENKSVIFDTTNLKKERRQELYNALKSVKDVNFKYKLMPLNPELAKQRIKRDLQEGKDRANVPDETINRHAKSYKQMLIDIKNENISNVVSKTNVSKVVDENGEPLMVYHGSKKKFDTFDKQLKAQNTGSSLAKQGFFFTPNKKLAYKYGEINYPVFLNIQNIKILDEVNYPDDEGFIQDKLIEEIELSGDIEYIKKLNKDGAKIEFNFKKGKTIEYITFNSNQIKSALLPTQQQKEEFDLNENKIGEFDKNNDNIYYQNNTNQSNEDYVASEKTIRDLAARMADRIGLKVKYENIQRINQGGNWVVKDIENNKILFTGTEKQTNKWIKQNKNYKGKLKNNVATINLAYATLDTPIHEILGHPIIRAIKNNTISYNVALPNYTMKTPDEIGITEYETPVGIVKKENGKWFLHKTHWSTGEVIKEEITKRYLDSGWQTSITASQFRKQGLHQLKPTVISKEKDNPLYLSLLTELETGKGKEVLDRVKRDYQHKKSSFTSGVKDRNLKLAKERLTKAIAEDDEIIPFFEKKVKEAEEAVLYKGRYTLEEQQEEALVELLGLMTADRLDKVKDGKLISLLKRLLKEIKSFMRSLLNQKEVEINKLPDNMTLGDLADLLAYRNNKLILPGSTVKYTTSDDQTFKTYQEASNHISNLFKKDKIDLDKKLIEQDKYAIVDEFGEEQSIFNTKEEAEEELNILNIAGFEVQKAKSPLEQFIAKNKKYEQSKKIIEKWREENNIQYDPEEVYSRGQGFYSVVGAYSNFDIELMFQNLLTLIEDNKIAGGEFIISALTKPVNKRLNHIEGRGGKIRFKIFPKSKDIKWASNVDAHSGSVWDAAEKFNKNKKSEIIGVSYTKAPSSNMIDTIQPNLANIIDNIAHSHNELGIELTTNNFRLEYDEDVPYSTKKILDTINNILDQKYGKLEEPKIYNNPKQPTQTKKNLKESIESIFERKTLELSSPKLIDKDAMAAIGGNIGGFWMQTNTGEFLTFDNLKEANVFKIENDNEKKYTKQAEINTKIAVLKEGFRKYPRSLIRSEVINNKMFNDTMYQTLQQKENSNLDKDKINYNNQIDDIFYQKNINQLNINEHYKNLKSVKQLKIDSDGTKREKLNLNNDKNYKKLLQEVSKLNKKQKTIRYTISKKPGEGKRKGNLFLYLHPTYLNTNEYLLNKVGLQTFDLNGRPKPSIRPLNKNNLNSVRLAIHKNSNLLLPYRSKFQLLKISGNSFSVNIVKNDKFIDDLYSLIENYNIDENIIIPNKIKESTDWFNMVNELGLGTSKKIYYYLKDKLLNKEEVKQYKNKNIIAPSDNYDTNKDMAEDFDEKTPENHNNNDIISESKDLIQNMVDSINIQDLEMKEPSKKELSIEKSLYEQFKQQLFIKRQLMFKYINKLNEEKKIQLLLDVKRLTRDIQTNDTNLFKMMGIINNDLKNISDNINSNKVDLNNLSYYKDTIDLWNTVLESIRDNNDEVLSEYLEGNMTFQLALIDQLSVISELKNKLLDLTKRLYLDEINITTKKLKLKDLSKVKEINQVSSIFLDASKTGNLLVDSIFKLTNLAEHKKSINYQKFIKEFDSAIDKLKSKGFDITKKEIKDLLLDNDNITDRFNNEYYIEMLELDDLRGKLNRGGKNSIAINTALKVLENKLFTYIDMSKLLDDKNQLDSNKLLTLHNKITNKYNIYYADEIINDIKKKLEQFTKDSISIKEWIKSKVLNDEEFAGIRKQGINETFEDVQSRINMEIEKIYKKWKANNNPITYIERRNGKSILYGGSDKYMVSIPKDKYFNEKMIELEQDHNEPLKEFHTYLKNILDKYVAYLPQDIQDGLLENFLPKVKSKFMEDGIKINGMLNDIKYSWIENNTASFSSLIKNIDVTGREIIDIPVRYVNKSSIQLQYKIKKLEKLLSNPKLSVKERDQIEQNIQLIIIKLKTIPTEYSNDIRLIFGSFVIMAENYNVFNKIESSIKAGQEILHKIDKVIPVNKVKQDTSDNYKTIKKGAENLIKTVDYHINATMYQKKKEKKAIRENLIFKNPELKKRYNEYNTKQKEIEKKYMNGELTSFTYYYQLSKITEKIKELFEAETPRLLTIDSLVDSAITITGGVNLGWNIKSAINNYVFGKVSLLTHAMGNEDFSVNDLKQSYKILNKAMRLGFKNNYLAEKIKNLTTLYDVVFEVNEAAYGSKTSLSKKTESLDIFKQYGMTRKGEYYLQNATLIAMLINTKIKVKDKLTGNEQIISLWDSYNSNGKFKEDYLYYNENTKKYNKKNNDYNVDFNLKEGNKLTTLIQKVEQINKAIHGNYDPNSPIAIKKEFWGRLIMQYKTWLPEGVAQRFEKEDWDDMLGRWRKGRYRTGWEYGFWRTFGLLFKSFFNRDNIANKTFGKEIDKANMLKNLGEFRMFVYIAIGQLTLQLLLNTLSDDDEDTKIKILKNMINQLSRLNNDLSFYFSPGNMLNTIENPAPAIQYLGKWLNLFSNLDKVVTKESYTLKDWTKSGSRLLPGFNEYNKWKRESERLNKDR